ncbi:hypothetical protein P43SY_003165 [Pythium insidiosum]|uniref:Transmembrane protein n=1 Tax=Pythium insidiosum TaxID=114742 RepID=A0AAD5Q5J1_PYTIN|nr:hypothetical protein P43SY_003165 [Pythium insidiosum]
MERLVPPSAPACSYGATPVESPVASSLAGTQPDDEATLGFLVPSSALHGDGSSDPPVRRQRDYVSRRVALFEGTSEGTEFGAVARLPLPLQVAFRVKMLSIFWLQLGFVSAIVTGFRVLPAAKRWADDTLDVALAVGSGVAALLLLISLYVLRNVFPINWLILLLFSIAESALFASLDAVLDTNVGVLNCGFTLCCVLTVLLLAGLRRRKDGTEGLLSTFYAGVIGYLVTTVLAYALFVWRGHAFISDEAFTATLVFQFFLVLWFAYDASSMYQVMSPDEREQRVPPDELESQQLDDTMKRV